MIFKAGPKCDDKQGLYVGDWQTLAPLLEDQSAALVFCDPPYEVDYTYADGTNDRDMPAVNPCDLVGVAKRVGRIVLITPGIANIWRYPPASWVVCWYKPGSTGRSACLNGFNTWEPVLVYGNPPGRVYQDSIALPSAANLRSKDFHGCPKPIALMRWLIDQFTNPSDLVIDFFIGSGTTAIAAKETGRGWLGFDINGQTIEIARQHVKAAAIPLPGIYHEQPRLLS